MPNSRLPLFVCLVLLNLTPPAAAQTIHVANVEELYAAVNDPAHAGATLVLSPGTYSLSAEDANGAPRPNGGRLELQKDMSIVGVEGHRGAAVINAGNLTATSFPQTHGPNAALRMGLGHNALEWLTVRDGRFAQANIDAGLQPLDPDTAYVRIAHIASTGGIRGLNVINFGPETSGQTIELDVVDCEFFQNTVRGSEGMRIGNFEGAVGATVNARLSGNVFWGQKAGRLIVNEQAMASTIAVLSTGNKSYDNALGTGIFGGLSAADERADGNTIDFEAHGDQFLANTADSPLDRGGLVVGGVEDVSNGLGGGSNNTVTVRLWGCRMGGNEPLDLLAMGARMQSDVWAANNQNNHVVIEIHGDGNGNGRWQPIESVVQVLPAAAGGGNTAVVVHK